MKTNEPTFEEFGWSCCMGPKLRQLVENQLISDLRHYGISQDNLRFDWSESLMEGHCIDYLDGNVENFSGISIYGGKDQLIAEGWMEFVNGDNFFLAYWEFIETWDRSKKIAEKKEIGIPDHVWKQIPDNLKSTWKKYKLKK